MTWVELAEASQLLTGTKVCPCLYVSPTAPTITPFHPPVNTTNLPVGTIKMADPHLKLRRTYEWNGALEQSLGKGQTLSLTYAKHNDSLIFTSVAPY
jgi:hypothetical protein